MLAISVYISLQILAIRSSYSGSEQSYQSQVSKGRTCWDAADDGSRHAAT